MALRILVAAIYRTKNLNFEIKVRDYTYITNDLW